MPSRTAVKPAPSSTPVLASRTRYMLLGLSALVLFGVFSRDIYDSDFWWHLRSGQYIVEQHKLPSPDPMSWTTPLARDAYPGEARTRQFNLTMEWLSQVAFYAIWKVGGSAAIVAARALSLTALCALIGLLAWRRRGSLYAALLAAFATAALARNFALDRPYQASYLAIGITLAILEYRSEYRRLLWLLPPLFLIWANCHAGFFLGWVVLGAWCTEGLLQRRFDRELWTCSGLAVLASGVNPNGFLIVPTLLNYRGSFLISRLNEWAHPTLWPPSVFSVLLFGAALVLLWARRRVRMADWLLFAAFALAAITAQRNIILVGILAPILIAAYLPGKFRTPSWIPYLLGALLTLGLGAGIARGSFFQLHAAEWKFPKGAADFLLAHHITQPMFNTYEYGGYLIWRLWPAQRTFIDGRALSESVFQDYARILYNHDSSDGQPAAEALLDRYGVQVIVMNTFEPIAGTIYVLAPALADPAQSTWKLVYNDPQAVIFMRTPPPGVQPLKSLDVLTHMEDECAVHLEHEPALPACARSLGQVFSKVGDFARARRWLGIYLNHPHAPDPQAEDAYRRLLAQ
ncbi:MAG: hypothetical protein ABI759_13805 [Candidatus Solibacter sp.]